ncbi:helix-turn-helix domain-containing protein [Rhodococcus qingshengii]|uniref:helix-turn-helix domain-containing protein n=1 Tax=Rhodococcus qingshengii TaxID=334542 RepID=UPI0010A66CBC|nr:helix-turn-helix transcriptional regulator [Rhodococcus qingshengii]THJ73974.1 helix-turn-helix transcriptional regulator [Rhodococcus qingshengii]
MGRTVRIWQKERQLSQDASAEVLAVHRTHIGGVERGERNLTLRSVEQIAETLGLDPLELLRDKSSPE